MPRPKSTVPLDEVHWGALKTLFPYLLEFRRAVALAILCLIGAKVAGVTLPFILKHIVDDLDSAGGVAQAIALPLGLLLAYGAVRFSSTLFGELRDTIFGRVTERAQRRVGLEVFQHLHKLDLDFHLDRRTGGLSRDIERGNSGIGFLMRLYGVQYRTHPGGDSYGSGVTLVELQRCIRSGGFGCGHYLYRLFRGGYRMAHTVLCEHSMRLNPRPVVVQWTAC